MKKTVTMKDIAERMQVSIVTISKALGDKDGVSEELRAEIKRMAEIMGYQYSASERAETRAVNIGVLVPHRFLGRNNSFYWDIYQSIMQQLSLSRGCAILSEIHEEDENDCVVPDLFNGRAINGVILLGQMKKPFVERINSLRLPLLLLDFYERELAVDSVINDNITEGSEVVDYLIKRGHRQIGFVGSIRHTTSILDRYIGTYKSLLENDLTLNPEWVLPDRDDHGNIYREFALPRTLPTAFVCNCDETAYHFVRTLKSRGLAVPDDISIISFDNYLYASLSAPPLTTMAVNIDRMAAQAVKTMLAKIREPNRMFGRQTVSDGGIIERQSVRTLG